MLTDELKAAADRGEPEDGSRYYGHWLAGLGHLGTTKGLTDPTELLERKKAWADGGLPLGKPVELTAGFSGPQRP